MPKTNAERQARWRESKKMIDKACGYKPGGSIQDDMNISQVLGELADAAVLWANSPSADAESKLYDKAVELIDAGWEPES